MKFEYENRESNRECVAYIDGGLGKNDHVVVKDSIYGSGWAVGPEGFGFIVDWCPKHATHKFYPGNKITITF